MWHKLVSVVKPLAVVGVHKLLKCEEVMLLSYWSLFVYSQKFSVKIQLHTVECCGQQNFAYKKVY